MTAAKKTAVPKPHWTDRLRSAVPTREVLANHPWLKPIAHRVLEPKLWHLQHEAVARGVAIGVFWAFAVPVAQMVGAAAHSIWWRANIPVAVGVTFITNPFTVGFWLWLAYKLGSLMLDAPPRPTLDESDGFLAWIASFGAPALLGMGIFAVGGALASYLLVKLAWRLHISLKRLLRTSRRR